MTSFRASLAVRGAASSVTVLVAGLLLTSCVASLEATVSADEARDSLVSTVEDSAAQIGVAGQTESLRNVALATTGHGDLVSP